MRPRINSFGKITRKELDDYLVEADKKMYICKKKQKKVAKKSLFYCMEKQKGN